MIDAVEWSPKHHGHMPLYWKPDMPTSVDGKNFVHQDWAWIAGSIYYVPYEAVHGGPRPEVVEDGVEPDLIKRLRDWVPAEGPPEGRTAPDAVVDMREAADRIEALQADKAKLRETLKQIEASTYPRPLGKSWRMDLSSSKHDRCIHDEWMYDTCEGCLDDFIRKALQETER